MRRVDRPLALAAGALIFYFVPDIQYHAAWIPVLAGVWVFGIHADLASTFGRAGLVEKYESNRLLAECVRRYGTRRAVAVLAACEAGLVGLVSAACGGPAGFDAADYAFVAGVVGAYHLHCARSNERFTP